MKHKCPIHGNTMLYSQTRYGPLWKCSIETCTMLCWGGETSRPADQETRDLRKACHAAFDPLWRFRRFKGRRAAYHWMQSVMGLKPAECHIGMFDAKQCRKLLEAITGLTVSA